MVKVGDKLKVLRPIPNNPAYNVGDILTVKRIDPEDGFLFFKETGDAGLFPERVKKGQLEIIRSKIVTEEMPKEKVGTRHNQNKLRWRNFPMFLIEPLIRVSHFGESKYETFNFLKGMKTNDSLDSLKRHLMKFEDPNQPDDDEESNESHLAHIAWNALVALYFLKTRPELDDRYKGEKE